MANIKKVKVGQTLYHYTKNRFDGKISYFTVMVKSVDDDLKGAVTSWNGNQPKWVPAHRFKNYRLKPPNNGRAKN